MLFAEDGFKGFYVLYRGNGLSSSPPIYDILGYALEPNIQGHNFPDTDYLNIRPFVLTPADQLILALLKTNISLKEGPTLDSEGTLKLAAKLEMPVIISPWTSRPIESLRIAHLLQASVTCRSYIESYVADPKKAHDQIGEYSKVENLFAIYFSIVLFGRVELVNPQYFATIYMEQPQEEN